MSGWSTGWLCCHLGWLEAFVRNSHWFIGIPWSSTKGNAKVLSLGRNSSICQHVLGVDWLARKQLCWGPGVQEADKETVVCPQRKKKKAKPRLEPRTSPSFISEAQTYVQLNWQQKHSFGLWCSTHKHIGSTCHNTSAVLREVSAKLREKDNSHTHLTRRYVNII